MTTSAAEGTTHNRRSYQQFCPAARALDLIGERWTMLLIRDLLTGPKRWSDLRASLPRLGSNLLAERLRSLEAGGLVVRRELPPPAARTVYDLTERGRDLDAVLLSLARFGLPYLGLPTEDEPLLPHLQDHALRPMVRSEALPPDGVTIRFELDEGHYLMEIAPLTGADGSALPVHRRLTVVPVEPYDETPAADMAVTASLPALLWVRQGNLGWDEAIGDGLVQVEGDADLVHALFRPDATTATGATSATSAT